MGESKSKLDAISLSGRMVIPSPVPHPKWQLAPRADSKDATAGRRSKSKVAENLRFLSTQLTDRSRLLAAAVIASCWAFLTTKDNHSPLLITACMGASVLLLICDYFQYLTQYLYFSKIEKNMRINKKSHIQLNERSILYKGRWFFFETKIFLTVFLAALFGVTISVEIYGETVKRQDAKPSVVADAPVKQALQPAPKK